MAVPTLCPSDQSPEVFVIIQVVFVSVEKMVYVNWVLALKLSSGRHIHAIYVYSVKQSCTRKSREVVSVRVKDPPQTIVVGKVHPYRAKKSVSIQYRV